MVTPGRFQIRSWMVIYVALIAAMVLAGRPIGPDAGDTGFNPAQLIIADSPLLRRDI